MSSIYMWTTNLHDCFGYIIISQIKASQTSLIQIDHNIVPYLHATSIEWSHMHPMFLCFTDLFDNVTKIPYIHPVPPYLLS